MPAAALKGLMQDFGGTGAESSGVTAWGEMAVVQNRWAPGFDGIELVRALFGDGLCPVPHWGYVITGTVGVRFADGREEFASAGESFYLPPGHSPFTSTGAEVIEFSPLAAMNELMAKAAALFQPDA